MKIIFICICISRNYIEIKKVINSLKNINNSKNYKIKILLLINKFQDKNVKILNKELKNKNIKIFKSKNKKIPESRNIILKYLRRKKFDFACFVDDDCYFKKNWVKNHFEFLNKNKKFHIVSGPQYSVPKNFYHELIAPKHKHETNINWCPTNNVFFKSNVIKKNKISFDVKLNDIGGSDQLFFNKLKLLGYKIIWNKNNPVFENYKNERNTLSWFINRNLRYSFSGHYMDIKLNGFYKGILISFLKINYYFLLFLTNLIIIPINPKLYATKSLMYLTKIVGRIKGILGFYIKKYI